MPLKRLHVTGFLISVALASVFLAGQSPLAAEPRAAFATDRWTGPYAGVGLGARVSDATWSTTCLQPSLSNCSPPWDGFPNRFANDNPAPFDMTGMRISGYAGYNWQIGNWVTGVEADIGWGHDKKTHQGIPGTWDPLLGPGRDATTLTTSTWDASLRGRMGILAAPDVLLYGTGGFAWLQTRAGASCEATFPIGWCVNPNSESLTKLLPGWTVGAGLEGQITSNLILRAEYRYSEYRDLKTTFFETMPVESFRVDISQRTHAFYVGISYLFGAR